MITYEPFWTTLKLRNMTTYTLINKYRISSSLIHRLRHNKPISTVTINDLCEILECDVTGIIKFTED
ncbi:MAG: helix-turn-helix transcriptional regulator [Clostridia bacterium]|nr:helix-turn-helix transcriptional regulator [Clostridia bacterium]NDO18218.1 helix-turn-helix transcriptional regulator [Lachnospiraceae bacterium MD329]